MKDLLEKLRFRMSLWMNGRYGSDSLSTALAVAVIVAMLADSLLETGVLMAVAYVGTIVVLFRCFSRNIAKRRKENEAWLRISTKPHNAARTASLMVRNRKTTLYLRCPQCKKLLSVPRGKGTLRVTCPNCKHQTSAKS